MDSGFAAVRRPGMTIGVSSQVERVAEAEEGGFAEGLAEGRVDVDRVRDIVEHRAHRQGMGEFAGEFRDLAADRLMPRMRWSPCRETMRTNRRPRRHRGSSRARWRRTERLRRRPRIPAAAASSGSMPATTISGSVKTIAATDRVETAALSGDDLGDHRALRHRLVRQHRLAGEVADRPDALRIAVRHWSSILMNGPARSSATLRGPSPVSGRRPTVTRILSAAGRGSRWRSRPGGGPRRRARRPSPRDAARPRRG